MSAGIGGRSRSEICGRRGRRSWITLGVLVAAGALLLATASGASALRYGVNAGKAEASELDYAWHSGASVFRVELDYTATSGKQWTAFDRMVRAAWLRGITILPVLDRSTEEGGVRRTRFLLSTDSQWNSWQNWVQEAVKRYGPKGEFWTGKDNPTPITAWEVGNEPNLPENDPILTKSQCEKIKKTFNVSWGTCIQPRAYGEFLKGTAAAIRSSSSESTVLFAGLYMQPGGESYDHFFSEANTVGGLSATYDGLAIHPYALLNGPKEVESKVNAARSLLNGISSGKTLWITELGWSIEPADNYPPEAKNVEPAQQAEYLEQSFKWINSVAAEKKIELLTWYNLRDSGPTGEWAGGTGLIARNGAFRPAWKSFQQMTGSAAWEGLPEDDDFAGPHIVGGIDGSTDAFWRTSSGGLGHSGWSPITGPVMDSISGQVVGLPHPVGQENGAIDVYWRTPTNQLGHAWRGSGGTTWASAPISAELASDPHAIAQGSGAQDVFWRTPSGDLGHFFWSPTASFTTSTAMTEKVASAPYPILRVGGAYDVFWRTAGGNLGHYWYVPGPGAEPHSAPIPAQLSGDPHVSAQPNGSYDVFWRTPSGDLGHFWYTPSGTGGPVVIPASMASDPHVFDNRWGGVDVFWRTTSNTLGHFWYVPGVGSNQSEIPASLASDPYVVGQPSGAYDVFWRTTGNTLGHFFYVPGSIAASETIPVSVSGSPHAVAGLGANLDVFWRTSLGNLGHFYYVPGVGTFSNEASASIAE
jgi:hypothetical protein